MIADLAAATCMFPPYGRTLNFAGGYYGIGVLSKHPCIESEVIELPNPNKHEPRDVVEGTFLIDGKQKVTFASTHLCVEDSLTRNQPAQTIAKRYEAGKYPVIIGGDFNSLPESTPLLTIEGVFVNLSGTEASFPSNAPEKKLDYLFGKTSNPTSDIEIISNAALDSMPRCSDHRPAVSKIKIKR